MYAMTPLMNEPQIHEPRSVPAASDWIERGLTRARRVERARGWATGAGRREEAVEAIGVGGQLQVGKSEMDNLQVGFLAI